MDCAGFRVSKDKIELACEKSMEYVVQQRELELKRETERLMNSWTARVTKGYFGTVTYEQAKEIYYDSTWFFPCSGIEEYSLKMKTAIDITECDKITLTLKEANWVGSWIKEGDEDDEE